MPDKNSKSRNAQSLDDSQTTALVSRPSQVPALHGKAAMPVGLSDIDNDDEPTEASALTSRQQAVLPIVALAPTRAEAARLSGVGESTLRRWFADPAFRRNVDQVRQQTNTRVAEELQKMLPLCVSVFADAMRSPDPALRLRAARYALSFIVRHGEVETIANDLKGLEGLSRSITKRNS